MVNQATKAARLAWYGIAKWTYITRWVIWRGSMKRCTERWSISGLLPCIVGCVLVRIAEEILSTYSCSRSHLQGGRHISRGWSHYASQKFGRQARPSFLFRNGSARAFSPDLREGSSPTFQHAQNRKPDWAWSIFYFGRKRRYNTSLTNPKVTNHLFGNHLCNGKDQHWWNLSPQQRAWVSASSGLFHEPE